MPLPTQDQITEKLRAVIDPELRRSIVELGMVRSIEVREGGRVEVVVSLTTAGCPIRSHFEQAVAKQVSELEGVSEVAVGFDVLSDEEKSSLQQTLGRGKLPAGALAQVKNVICVASGKGGVGKSSLTANLAVAFSQSGRRTGILDADIYGHSIPHILGIHQKPVAVDQMIVPPVKDRLKLMSIGFFLDDNEPVMWRGPMLHRALEQFLTDVHWGELDVLVVDMPPGTGDVSISLGQLLPRAEVLVVTTPQRVAQEVASRAAQMAQKTNMRLIGVVENMSGEIFGSGGGDRLAEELGVPMLGRVPLDPLLRECGDAGEPLVAVAPDSETTLAIVAVADAVRALEQGRGVVTKQLPLVGG
jgi:ATP-binding protein involved in chromosome partitioning